MAYPRLLTYCTTVTALPKAAAQVAFTTTARRAAVEQPLAHSLVEMRSLNSVRTAVGSGCEVRLMPITLSTSGLMTCEAEVPRSTLTGSRPQNCVRRVLSSTRALQYAIA